MSETKISFAKINHSFFLKARELALHDKAQARMLLNLGSEEVDRLANLDIEDIELIADVEAPLVSVNVKKTDVMLKLIDALERQDDNALLVLTQKMSVK